MARKLTAAAAAASLVVLPIAAQALPQRAPAETSGENEQIVGLLWQYILLPIVIAAILAAINGGDDEMPTSP